MEAQDERAKPRREAEMSTIRWEPYRDLVSLQERMNRLFNDSLSRWSGEETYGSWTPPVDIFEKNESLVILAELPGLRREDIDISVEGGTLTLRGERRRDNEVKEESYYRVERRYGVFARSFSLPTSVDAEKIQATYSGGLLRIELPKAEEARPKRVEISGS
jgi:HSP20 family protein